MIKCGDYLIGDWHINYEYGSRVRKIYKADRPYNYSYIYVSLTELAPLPDIEHRYHIFCCGNDSNFILDQYRKMFPHHNDDDFKSYDEARIRVDLFLEKLSKLISFI